MVSKLPSISVVIPSKNEERNISNCLKSIRLQSYPQDRIETIVVVNEDSIDKTKIIAKKYTKKVFIKGRERSEPRNFGMLVKATGEYLIYLDADMILSSTVIAKAVEKLDKSNLVALYIPEIILGYSFWSRVRRFERSFYDGTATDCVRIVRKDVFIKTGGFDIKLSGPEDWDLDKKIRNLGPVAVLNDYDFEQIDQKVFKLNYQTADLVEQLASLSPKALIYHNEAEFNLQKYFSKKAYYSRSFDSYIKKWGKDDPDIRKQFGFWYRYFGVFLENGKWKRLFKHPLLAMGVFVLRFGVGVIFLTRKIKK